MISPVLISEHFRCPRLGARCPLVQNHPPSIRPAVQYEPVALLADRRNRALDRTTMVAPHKAPVTWAAAEEAGGDSGSRRRAAGSPYSAAVRACNAWSQALSELGSPEARSH